MLSIKKTLCSLTVAAVLTGGVAFAQHDNHQNDQHGSYVKHDEWHKGAKIDRNDWNRGAQVDWHAHHLQAPPRGYEWREVDGNYVLAAAASGLIAATVIAASH